MGIFCQLDLSYWDRLDLGREDCMHKWKLTVMQRAASHKQIHVMGLVKICFLAVFLDIPIQIQVKVLLFGRLVISRVKWTYLPALYSGSGVVKQLMGFRHSYSI